MLYREKIAVCSQIHTNTLCEQKADLHMRTSIFWVITPQSLKVGPIGCPETSAGNYHYTLRNNPKQLGVHLLRAGSPKSSLRSSHLQATELHTSSVCSRLHVTQFQQPPICRQQVLLAVTWIVNNVSCTYTATPRRSFSRCHNLGDVFGVGRTRRGESSIEVSITRRLLPPTLLHVFTSFWIMAMSLQDSQLSLAQSYTVPLTAMTVAKQQTVINVKYSRTSISGLRLNVPLKKKLCRNIVTIFRTREWF
jgi:hypothetical protein